MFTFWHTLIKPFANLATQGIHSVEDVKSKVINTTIIVATIVGFVAYSFGLVSRFSGMGFTLSLLFETLIISFLLTISILRKRLRNTIKAYILISLILLFTISDSYFFGVFSTARIYLILIPLLSIVYFSLAHTLVLFFSSVLLFIFIGYMHYSGLLALPPEYEPSIYAFRLYPWIINSIHITAVSLIVLYVIHSFFSTFTELVSRLKDTNNKISESERNYKEIFNSTSEALFVHNPTNGSVVDVNKAMLRIFGYNDKQEVVGKNISSFSYEQSMEEKALEKIHAAAKGNQQLFEWVSVRSNGEPFSTEVSLRSTIIAGEPMVLAVVRDVSERKKAQKALEESEKRYRDMADLAPLTIWESNLDGLCTYTNTSGYKVHGYTDEDFKQGVYLINLVVHEDRERAVLNLKKRIEGKVGGGEEYTGLHKDGTRFPVRIYSSVIYKNGKPIGFRGATVDISDIKKAEQNLRESEERYRKLVETSQDGISLMDIEGNMLYVNKRKAQMVGTLEPKDLIGKNAYDLLTPKSRVEAKKLIPELIEKGFIESFEAEVNRIDGTIFTAEFNITVLTDENGNPTHLMDTMRDITERKQTTIELEKYRNHLEILVKERTEELEATNEELQATNEELYNHKEELQTTLSKLQNAQKQLIEAEKMASLGILAAGVAHEINNPLNFIHGGVSALEDYVKNNLTDHHDPLSPLIEIINTGVTRAASIVEGLSHYSRSDNVHKVFDCDIHKIIDNCLLMLDNKIKNRILVERNYASKPIIVKCKEGKMHQAFLNVLTNAVQAIEGNGTISISTALQQNVIGVTICDDGCGISKKDISKVTDPFFTTKDPGKGTGLGLSITQNIIHEHGGSITFDSEKNAGTTVNILIPIKN